MAVVAGDAFPAHLLLQLQVSGLDGDRRVAAQTGGAPFGAEIPLLPAPAPLETAGFPWPARGPMFSRRHEYCGDSVHTVRPRPAASYQPARRNRPPRTTEAEIT